MPVALAKRPTPAETLIPEASTEIPLAALANTPLVLATMP